MRKDDPEFYEDGLSHSEAAIYVLKNSNKALRTEEIFEMVKPLRLMRKVSSTHSLYATLCKLKHSGVVEYGSLTRKWCISNNNKRLKSN